MRKVLLTILILIVALSLLFASCDSENPIDVEFAEPQLAEPLILNDGLYSFESTQLIFPQFKSEGEDIYSQINAIYRDRYDAEAKNVRDIIQRYSGKDTSHEGRTVNPSYKYVVRYINKRYLEITMNLYTDGLSSIHYPPASIETRIWDLKENKELSDLKDVPQEEVSVLGDMSKVTPFEIIINEKISDDYNEFNFKFVAMDYDDDDEMGTICSMTVTDNVTDALIQRIDIHKEMYMDHEMYFYDPYLIVDDYNFDGYKDILMIKANGGAYDILHYFCYLFNPNNNLFEYCPSFEEIRGPNIDSINNLIKTRNHDGITFYYWEKYQFIEGEFILTNYLSETISPENHEISYREEIIENGERKVIEEFTMDYFDKDPENMPNEKYYEQGSFWDLANNDGMADSVL